MLHVESLETVSPWGLGFSRKEEAERDNCCFAIIGGESRDFSASRTACDFRRRYGDGWVGLLRSLLAFFREGGWVGRSWCFATQTRRQNLVGRGSAEAQHPGVLRRSAGTICGRPVWLAGYGLSSPLYIQNRKKGTTESGRCGGGVFEPEVGWGLPGLGQSFYMPHVNRRDGVGACRFCFVLRCVDFAPV